MISKKITDALNTQMNREFYSAFLYLAMSNDAMDKGFKGTAKWFNQQFVEEQTHAFKFAHYLQEQGAKVTLDAIEKPAEKWADVKKMFSEALAHEKKVTAWINEIMKMAVTENDFATQNALQWFIKEQVEEEASVSDILWMLEMSSGSNGAMFMADKQLGKRE